MKGFDVIHASPPCQAYSKTNAKYRYRHPDLIKSVRKRIKDYNYVIENVPDARKLLKNPLMLCGGMFGLPIHRHRYFEISPFVFTLLPQCNVPTETVYITGTPRPKDVSPRRDPPAHVKSAAMGTPWMTIKNMDEAIPPAYTEYIGKQLMRIINR